MRGCQYVSLALLIFFLLEVIVADCPPCKDNLIPEGYDCCTTHGMGVLYENETGKFIERKIGTVIAIKVSVKPEKTVIKGLFSGTLISIDQKIPQFEIDLEFTPEDSTYNEPIAIKYDSLTKENIVERIYFDKENEKYRFKKDVKFEGSSFFSPFETFVTTLNTNITINGSPKKFDVPGSYWYEGEVGYNDDNVTIKVRKNIVGKVVLSLIILFCLVVPYYFLCQHIRHPRTKINKFLIGGPLVPMGSFLIDKELLPPTSLLFWLSTLFAIIFWLVTIYYKKIRSDHGVVGNAKEKTINPTPTKFYEAILQKERS